MTELLNVMLSGCNAEKLENYTPCKRRRMMDKITPLPKFENTSRRLKRAHDQAKRIQILSSL